LRNDCAVEVDRYEGDGVGFEDACFGEALAFPRLRRRVIDLKDPEVNSVCVVPIGKGIKSSAEQHVLVDTLATRLFERVLSPSCPGCEVEATEVGKRICFHGANRLLAEFARKQPREGVRKDHWLVLRDMCGPIGGRDERRAAGLGAEHRVSVADRTSAREPSEPVDVRRPERRVSSGGWSRCLATVRSCPLRTQPSRRTRTSSAHSGPSRACGTRARYFRSRAFLHFHDGESGRYADVRFSEDWERAPAATPRQRAKLLERVRRHVERRNRT